MFNKPVVLAVLDGWGLAPAGPGNAVSLSKTPNLDRYWSSSPKTLLSAAGESVGLPEGERGNSETGHLNLGAGQVVFQDLPRINMSINDGSFFKNPAFNSAFEHAQKYHSKIHLLGLIGSGGVHSNIEHLIALIRLYKQKGCPYLYLHLFTDGRDSPPQSSLIYLNLIKQETQKANLGSISSLCGRYYAMDRDNRWERTQKAYDLITQGKGKNFENIDQALQDSYARGKTDEFLEPVILDKKGLIEDNDALVFYNFRIDRPRQLTKALVLTDFENRPYSQTTYDPYAEKYGLKGGLTPVTQTAFKRNKTLKNLFMVTMTEYEKGLPVQIAYPPSLVYLPLARILSEAGLRQIHLSESEKERFVTYYFDGLRDKPFPGEVWQSVASPQVPTYDMQPEMSAVQLTDMALKNLRSSSFNFMLINYANPDMVGHTGVIPAAIKACETVDFCLGKLVDETVNMGGVCLITADHGNIEEMINLKTGGIDTEHSLNPVPFILVNNQFLKLRSFVPNGLLADVAPTILDLFQIQKPSMLTGQSLLNTSSNELV